MKLYFTILISFIVTASFCQNKKLKDIELRITPEKTEISLSAPEYIKVEAEFINRTSDTLILVSLGDGSESGWRTPFILWSVLDVKMKNLHPRKLETTDLKIPMRCGNINPLKEDELIFIPPNGIYNWSLGLNINRNIGKYSVKLLYRNQPSLLWRGIPLGVHNQKAMQIIQDKSMDITLISNEITITVLN